MGLSFYNDCLVLVILNGQIRYFIEMAVPFTVGYLLYQKLHFHDFLSDVDDFIAHINEQKSVFVQLG